MKVLPIEANLCPDGIVVHVVTDKGDMLAVRLLASPEDAMNYVEEDIVLANAYLDAHPRGWVTAMGYDGDSGEYMASATVR